MNEPIRATIAVSYEHQVHFTHGVFHADNPLLATVLASKPSGRIPRVLIVLDENLANAQPKLAPAIKDYFASRTAPDPAGIAERRSPDPACSRENPPLAGSEAGAPGAVSRCAQFELVADPICISGGEAAKNSEAGVKQIYAAIEQYGLCRHCYVIGIGGGALLDVVGFAAATAHRGVRHVRMPTTVLAQDDAGVGVKNGINAFGKKNFIGTFAPPFAVINDFDMLASLPEREKRAGYIEAIKVALIRDAKFFEFIESSQGALQTFEPAAVEQLIRQCAEAHVRHIATGGDPFEQGSARPLDFGHWAAHKLEQLSEFRIHHGEAVAIGIALDVIYSKLAGHLDAGACERILKLIEALGFELCSDELTHKGPDGKLTVLNGLEEFREHLGGALTITLIKAVGQGFEVHEMDEAKVQEAIIKLSQRQWNE